MANIPSTNTSFTLYWLIANKWHQIVIDTWYHDDQSEKLHDYGPSNLIFDDLHYNKRPLDIVNISSDL